MEIRERKTILLYNRTLCRNGIFKDVQTFLPITQDFDNNVFIDEPKKIPKINVASNISVVSIGCGLINPVIMNTIGSEFNFETRDDVVSFRDYKLYLRSNLCNSLYIPKLLPLEKPDNVIYIKNVLFFRNEQINTVRVPVFISVINVVPVKEPKLIAGRMTYKDYLTTSNTIENFFLLGNMMGHKSIVLSNFGCNNKDKHPCEDIVEIYNYCIIKYGHLFNDISITFEILEKNDLDNLKYFQNNINRLNLLIDE